MKYLLLILYSLVCFFSMSAQTQKIRNQQSINAIPLPKDSLMIEKAQKGDACAEAFIGYYYYHGYFCVAENDQEALRWIQKSYTKGSPFGTYFLASLYRDGVVVPENKSKWLSLLKKCYPLLKELADSGNPYAQLLVAWELLEENIMKRDEKAAFELLNKSVEGGFLFSLHSMGCIFRDISKDKDSFCTYLQAAELNLPDSQFETALCYLNGRGTAKNMEKAIYWLKQSANNGCQNAQFWLGNCYEEGNGVTNSIEEAIKWYHKSAEGNIYGALYKLGCFYRDGYGVDRNYDLAIKYMSKAAKEGEDNAIHDLSEMKKKGKLYYQKLPKRSPLDIYELKDGDPFASMILSDNWNELDEESKRLYQKQFKKEKIREWGIERATQVANHIVEIGFTSEQLRYSQGYRYDVHVIEIPKGRLCIMTYPHCTYYLLNDKLIAMSWSNGAQVGDIKLIESYSGNTVITTGNR